MSPDTMLVIAGNAIFLLGVIYSSRLTVRYAKDLKVGLENLQKISTKVAELETDFNDKYVETVRKFSSRQAMRDRREAKTPEDSNSKPNGGILYGPTEQH